MRSFSANMTLKDIQEENLKGSAATEALRNGKVDALFIVAGYPTGALVELASAADMKLVPIAGEGVEKLTSEFGFFSTSSIPAEAYEGVGEAATVAVGAQWFTHVGADVGVGKRPEVEPVARGSNRRRRS